MILFFKLLLFNTISVAEGFCITLLFRELYWKSLEERRQEEFVPTTFESVESLLPTADEFTEPSVSLAESVLEQVSPSSTSPSTEENGHRKVDELDVSLLPKGFKVEEIIDQMQTIGTSESPLEQVAEFSVVPILSANPESFDEPLDEEMSAPIPPIDSKRLPDIDVAEKAGSVSSLAIELLGEGFDFQSMLKTPSDAVEEWEKIQERKLEESDGRQEQEFGHVVELGNDVFQIESGFLKDVAAIRESATDRQVESHFPREMVETMFIEQNPPANLVETVLSSPMLPRRRGKRR